MDDFSLLPVVVLGLVVFGIFKLVKGGSGPGDAVYCTTCGSEAPAKSVTKGSIGIELILWLLFLVPGLIYSIWRLTTKHRACKVCGSTVIIPPQSPQALAAKKVSV